MPPSQVPQGAKAVLLAYREWLADNCHEVESLEVHFARFWSWMQTQKRYVQYIELSDTAKAA